MFKKILFATCTLTTFAFSQEPLQTVAFFNVDSYAAKQLDYGVFEAVAEDSITKLQDVFNEGGASAKAWLSFRAFDRAARNSNLSLLETLLLPSSFASLPTQEEMNLIFLNTSFRVKEWMLSQPEGGFRPDHDGMKMTYEGAAIFGRMEVFVLLSSHVDQNVVNETLHKIVDHCHSVYYHQGCSVPQENTETRRLQAMQWMLSESNPLQPDRKTIRAVYKKIPTKDVAFLELTDKTRTAMRALLQPCLSGTSLSAVINTMGRLQL